MNSTKKNYHHGDLKITLIQTARQLLNEEGVTALSMRKLADCVGVSRTALYHHFKDKNALLCAIAEEGFQQQAEELIHLIQIDNQNQDATRKAFRDYVFLYIQFAQQQQELYDLMYGRTLWQIGQPSDSLKQASRHTFKLWIDWVSTLQKANVLTNDNPLRVGQATWASLHGLARFVIDGIYIESEGVTEMAEQMLNMIMTKEHTLLAYS